MPGEALELARRSIRESISTCERLLDGESLAAIVRAAELITSSLAEGGKLLLFGNGGSAADASHIAAEFVGRFRDERRPLAAVSLTDNHSAVTAIGNDYGFETVFSRQVQALGRPADVAMAISTSGRSRNVLAGVEAATRVGMATIGLTGGDGGALAGAVDLCIAVAAPATARIQEGHILVGHLLCELVEHDIA